MALHKVSKLLLTMLVVGTLSSPIRPPDASPPIFSSGPRRQSYSLDAVSNEVYTPPSAPQYAQAPSRNVQASREYRQESYEDVPPKYTFDFGVQDQYSGVNFNQQEQRDGYNTQGAYYVALPDGRTQKVTYYVNGDSGFVAEVSYEGEAQYPQVSRESYQAPRGYQ